MSALEPCSPEWWAAVKDWRPWYAWRPVTLLTGEIAFGRWIERRPTMAGRWGDGKWDYANRG